MAHTVRIHLALLEVAVGVLVEDNHVPHQVQVIMVAQILVVELVVRGDRTGSCGNTGGTGGSGVVILRYKYQ